MLQTVRAERVDKKMVLFMYFPCFLPGFLKLSKKMYFLQFRADLSQKPKSVKAIYIYGSESSYYSFSENDMVYRGLSHHS